VRTCIGLLAGALALAGVVACGAAGRVDVTRHGGAGDGRIDARGHTYDPTARCTTVVVHGPHGAHARLAPPVPVVTASRRGWRITVRWRFLRRTARCVPAAVLVLASSVDDLSNAATAGGDDRFLPVAGDEGQVTFDAPMLDLPPYEARVAVYGRDGIRTVVTTVPIAGSEAACSDARPVAWCMRRARALFRRCIEGRAERSRCHPRAWRAQPPLPNRPLRGVAPAALAASLRRTERRMEGAGAELADESVSCRGTRICDVVWQGPGRRPNRFTIRFTISAGAANGHGCWIAARYRIVRPPRERGLFEQLRAMWGVGFTRPSACTSWR
jgi:hypothetical protein